MAVVNHERQSPFPSRPNRGGSNASKAKKRDEADKKIKKWFSCLFCKIKSVFILFGRTSTVDLL